MKQKEKYIKSGSRADIVTYIDQNGNKKWKWRTKKGAIYGK